MSYPPPPPPGPPAGKPKLRGRVPLRLGIIFLVLGVLCLVPGIYVVATKSLSKIDTFQRVKIDNRSGSLSFSKTGGYVAYYEADDVTTNTAKVPLVGVRLTSPSGKSMTVTTKYGNNANGTIKKLTYDYHGHHGLALYQFHIAETGRYQVALTPNTLDGPNATMAFGESFASGTALGVSLVVLGVLLLLAGIPLLIVGLVKRSNSKKELARQSQYAMPPAGGSYWSGPQGPPGQPPGYQRPPGPPPPGSAS